MVKPGPGTTVANNKPVGSAGQPVNKQARMSAIQRRLNKKKDKETGK